MTRSSPEKIFDFAAGDPNRLLVECEPEDLFNATKALPRWTVRALDITQSALAYWAGNVIASAGNREGLGELRSLIRRLQVVQPLDQQDPALDVASRYQHWTGIVAVLEARSHLMDYHDAEAIEGRAHMKELRNALQAADAAGVPTQTLQESLALSKARLSQVLALAEAAGLIERRKQERQKWVSAAGAWRQRSKTADLPETSSNAPQKYAEKRGLRLLVA